MTARRYRVRRSGQGPRMLAMGKHAVPVAEPRTGTPLNEFISAEKGTSADTRPVGADGCRPCGALLGRA